MSDQISVTIVNHVALAIAAPPEAVWRTILDEYVEAKKFREIGYAIDPLDEAGAPLGGYTMRFEQDGKIVDQRICHITERDEAAHRLSLYADYGPGGMKVHVTYHADDAPGGTLYRLDCHSALAIPRPEDGDIAAAVAATTAQFDAALAQYLASIKTRVEEA